LVVEAVAAESRSSDGGVAEDYYAVLGVVGASTSKHSFCIFFHSFELSSLAVVEHNQSYFLKKNIISPFSFYCETKIVLYNEKGRALAMVPLKNINWSVCCIISSTITHLEIILDVFRCQMQHLSRSRKRTTIA